MRHSLLLVCCIAINFALAVFASDDYFPTVDEARQVVAGLDDWKTGMFREAIDIPPLAPLASALPIVVREAWGEPPGMGSPAGRPPNLPLADFRAARLPTLLWWAVGAWLIARWASELFGVGAGSFALILWSFGPSILAREQLATADLPAAVAFFGATYAFLRWLRSPSWEGAALSGLLFGVAQLTEFAALALLIAWPATGLVYYSAGRRLNQHAEPKRLAVHIAVGLGAGLLVVHDGYGFARSGLCLRDLNFASRSLGGGAAPGGPMEGKTANRFRGTWLGSAIVPLPAGYVEGIDRRLREAEVRIPAPEIGSDCLADRGAFSLRTLFAKAPLGTWGLLAGALVLTFVRPTARVLLAEELAVWAPAAILIALALSPVGFLFSMPTMLVLPAPFAIVGMSKLSRLLPPWRHVAGWPVAGLMVWSVYSSLACYPHSLYYLNEAAGGWRGIRSQVRHALPGDAGQDLLLLKRWVDGHVREPYGLGIRHVVDFSAYGIPPTVPPVISQREIADLREYTPWGGPCAGYYAMDVFHLNLKKYAYLKNAGESFPLGPTLLVLHLGPDESDEARRQAGLATDRDLTALKVWQERHPEAQPIGLACRAIAEPGRLGGKYTTPPVNPGPALANAPWYTPRVGPYPGWYAVDRASLSMDGYGYFNRLAAVDQVGDSILIYRVTREDANRVRGELGLPVLAESAALRKTAAGRGLLRRTYESPEGKIFNYAVFVPADYSHEKPYPLILFLHGYGDRGPNGAQYLRVGLPAAIERMGDAFGFFCLFPEGHTGAWHVGGEDARMAMALLSRIQKEYNVDPRRISLTGVSSGAAGTWGFAAHDPHRWAAIVPVATVGCNVSDAPLIKGVPCWCFHNSYDQKSSPEIPRGMINALREIGGTPRYTEFARLTSDDHRWDKSHNAWAKASSMPELYEWLIQQRLP